MCESHTCCPDRSTVLRGSVKRGRVFSGLEFARVRFCAKLSNFVPDSRSRTRTQKGPTFASKPRLENTGRERDNKDARLFRHSGATPVPFNSVAAESPLLKTTTEPKSSTPAGEKLIKAAAHPPAGISIESGEAIETDSALAEVVRSVLKRGRDSGIVSPDSNASPSPRRESEAKGCLGGAQNIRRNRIGQSAAADLRVWLDRGRKPMRGRARGLGRPFVSALIRARARGWRPLRRMSRRCSPPRRPTAPPMCWSASTARPTAASTCPATRANTGPRSTPVSIRTICPSPRWSPLHAAAARCSITRAPMAVACIRAPSRWSRRPSAPSPPAGAQAPAAPAAPPPLH